MKLHRISLALAAFLLIPTAHHAQGEDEASGDGRSENANSPTSGLLDKPDQVISSASESASGDGGKDVSPEKNAGETVYGRNKDQESEKTTSRLNPLPDLSIWLWTFVVLLVFLGILYYLKKKGFLGKLRNQSAGRLKIKDQIMLGNRQFLVVVEYGSREVLVGIGPGFIRHVCDLGEAPLESSGHFEEVLSGNMDVEKDTEKEDD